MTASRLTTNSPYSAPATKQEIASLLTEARDRTLLLISGLSNDDLQQQHDPLMSPIIWDVGHIAHFEELWLTQNLDGPIEFTEMPGLYNPFEHPRATRASLALPTLSQMMTRLKEIRSRVLDRLETVEFDERNPLLRDAYVYHMVLQHEYQHNETILQTLQLKKGEPYQAPRARTFPTGHPARKSMVGFAGGTVTIGTDDRSAAYDNERPLHEIDLRPFLIDRDPVTNARYLEFIGDRGYQRTELWSEGGRRWLAESGAIAPKYWTRDGIAGHPAAWISRDPSIRRIPFVMSVTTRPKPSPSGTKSGCRRNSSGRLPHRGIPQLDKRARIPGVRRNPTRSWRTSISSPSTLRPSAALSAMSHRSAAPG